MECSIGPRTKIYQLNDLQVGVIRYRIAQLCKTPYVAEAVINGKNVMVQFDLYSNSKIPLQYLVLCVLKVF